MRVAATTPIWLFCLIVFATEIASADILEVEPDLFPELTVLNVEFPGVVLSNQTLRGDPDETDVLVRSGLKRGGPGAGLNFATTGEFVFGRESAPEGPPPGQLDNLINWSQFLPGVGGETERSAALRADFVIPVGFVSIKAVTVDNGAATLQAYDNSGSGVPIAEDFQNSPSGGAEFSLSVTRAERDIYYILAFGVANLDGGGPLDDLQVEFVTLPVFIDVKPGSKKNNINLCSRGIVQVAVLSFPKFPSGFYFDARDVDPTTLVFAGATVKLDKNGDPITKMRDVNDDGLVDLIAKFEIPELDLVSEDTEAELRGTMDGKPFVGKDAVEVKQQMCVRTLE